MNQQQDEGSATTGCGGVARALSVTGALRDIETRLAAEAAAGVTVGADGQDVAGDLAATRDTLRALEEDRPYSPWPRGVSPASFAPVEINETGEQPVRKKIQTPKEAFEALRSVIDDAEKLYDDLAEGLPEELQKGLSGIVISGVLERFAAAGNAMRAMRSAARG